MTTDPYKAYAILDDANRGAYWHDVSKSWYVTAPGQVRKMLGDRRFAARGASPLDEKAKVCSRAHYVVELERFLGMWPVFSDNDAQRAASQALRKFFSPGRAETMRNDLAATFQRVVNKSDCTKLVATFAQPISEAMLSTLLGLTESETGRVRSMTEGTIQYLSNDGQDTVLAENALTQIEELEAWLKARTELGNDWILSALSDAGVRLTLRELTAVYMQVVTGALDPTSNAIAGGLITISRSPEAAGFLERKDYKGLTNYCLGQDTGFHFAPRRAACPVSMEGFKIDEGDRVVGVLAWAAHAESEGRSQATVTTPSLAFGHGRHFCLGANIALVTLEESLRAFFEAYRIRDIDVSGIERIPALGASVYTDRINFR
ncbi:cytochrome P450 [Arthrobacter sp. AG258]|uniref:cytochrome P450 n=1 Tax=Arthrobacter sp. AG258 TaxID=2183899 RepID=UPI00105DE455|nr:cytochrome P450 [Arthrobacter sp. AG258]